VVVDAEGLGPEENARLVTSWILETFENREK